MNKPNNLEFLYWQALQAYFILLLPYQNKLECLPPPFTSTIVWYIQAWLEPIKVEPLSRLHPSGRLQALPATIRLGWKRMAWQWQTLQLF